MVLEFIILATVLVSLASIAGIIVLFAREKWTQLLLFLFVSFAAGTLLGAAFLDLLPEAFGEAGGSSMLAALAGMMAFFAIEKIIHWHHHHDPHKRGEIKVKPLGALNLIGDGLHNFFDGAAIAASFMVGIPTGVSTTLAVILHEIPQEIGDFSLLLYSGYSKSKALLFNFISALLAVIGGITFYQLSPAFEHLTGLALGFTGGMFIYIAAADLVPELHKEKDPSKSLQQLLLILLGIAAIWLIVTYIEA